VGEKRGNVKVGEWNCLYDKAPKKPDYVEKWDLITLYAKWNLFRAPISQNHPIT
jgi:hypothetical protein